VSAEVPESHRDLLDQPVGILVTNGPDGYPQSTATWVVNDGGLIKISIHRDRQKYKNLARDPKIGVFLVDGANIYRTLEIRGDAEIADDADASFFRSVVVAHGVDPETFPVPADNRVIVTVNPTRVNVYG
jgi:PPOX class probable F420-dependent enzyme